MAFALLLLFQYYPVDGEVRILLAHHNVTLVTSAFILERRNSFCLSVFPFPDLSCTQS